MEIPSLTGLQSSLVRSSLAFTGIAKSPAGQVSLLLAQVQGLALDSVNLATGDLAALAANQIQMQRALLNLRDLAPLREKSPLGPAKAADTTVIKDTYRPTSEVTMALSLSASVAAINTQSILPTRSPSPKSPPAPEVDVVALSIPLRSLEDSLPPTALLRDPNSAAELASATSQQITSSVLGNANQTAALVASLLRG